MGTLGHHYCVDGIYVADTGYGISENEISSFFSGCQIGL